MKISKEIKEKTKKFFTSKKFIAYAIVFLLAIGTGVTTSVRVNRQLKEQLFEFETSSGTELTTEKSTEEAAGDVTGVTIDFSREEITAAKKEDFIFPLSKKVIKDYSNSVAVKSKTMNDWRVHNGVDFEARVGQEVKAINSGAVLAIYNNSLWGTVVEIDHGAGVVAKYCGLSSDCRVTANDVVEKGQVIGSIGDIPVEAADGCHLHLEITENGKIIDPLEMLTGE